MKIALLVTLFVLVVLIILLIRNEYRYFKSNLVTCIENNYQNQINFRSFDDWLSKYKKLRTPKWILRLLIIYDLKFVSKFEVITLFDKPEWDLIIKLAR